MEMKPSQCPFCNASVEETISGFVEVGAYLGERYEVEGAVSGYVCTGTGQHGFYVWPDGAAINEQKISALRETYDKSTLASLRDEGYLD